MRFPWCPTWWGDLQYWFHGVPLVPYLVRWSPVLVPWGSLGALLGEVSSSIGSMGFPWCPTWWGDLQYWFHGVPLVPYLVRWAPVLVPWGSLGALLGEVISSIGSMGFPFNWCPTWWGELQYWFHGVPLVPYLVRWSPVLVPWGSLGALLGEVISSIGSMGFPWCPTWWGELQYWFHGLPLQLVPYLVRWAPVLVPWGSLAIGALPGEVSSSIGSMGFPCNWCPTWWGELQYWFHGLPLQLVPYLVRWAPVLVPWGSLAIGALPGEVSSSIGSMGFPCNWCPTWWGELQYWFHGVPLQLVPYLVRWAPVLVPWGSLAIGALPGEVSSSIGSMGFPCNWCPTWWSELQYWFHGVPLQLVPYLVRWAPVLVPWASLAIGALPGEVSSSIGSMGFPWSPTWWDELQNWFQRVPLVPYLVKWAPVLVPWGSLGALPGEVSSSIGSMGFHWGPTWWSELQYWFHGVPLVPYLVKWAPVLVPWGSLGALPGEVSSSIGFMGFPWGPTWWDELQNWFQRVPLGPYLVKWAPVLVPWGSLGALPGEVSSSIGFMGFPWSPTWWDELQNWFQRVPLVPYLVKWAPVLVQWGSIGALPGEVSSRIGSKGFHWCPTWWSELQYWFHGVPLGPYLVRWVPVLVSWGCPGAKGSSSPQQCQSSSSVRPHNTSRAHVCGSNAGSDNPWYPQTPMNKCDG